MSRYAIRAGLKQSSNAFVNSYGSYADEYNLVRPNGNQVTSVFLWILIAAFIIGALFAFINSRIPEDKKKKNTSLNYLSLFLLGVLGIAVGTCGFSVIYLFFYWIVYKVQYFRWFASLPNEAKIAHAAMSATKSLISKK
tara:strand:+ start:342 stop:758 length:417 start_codon:yes stop_codon:yes gene_type:complete